MLGGVNVSLPSADLRLGTCLLTMLVAATWPGWRPNVQPIAMLVALASTAFYSFRPAAGISTRVVILAGEVLLRIMYSNPHVPVAVLFFFMRVRRDTPGLAACHMVYSCLTFPPVLETSLLSEGIAAMFLLTQFDMDSAAQSREKWGARSRAVLHAMHVGCMAFACALKMFQNQICAALVMDMAILVVDYVCVAAALIGFVFVYFSYPSFVKTTSCSATFIDFVLRVVTSTQFALLVVVDMIPRLVGSEACPFVYIGQECTSCNVQMFRIVRTLATHIGLLAYVLVTWDAGTPSSNGGSASIPSFAALYSPRRAAVMSIVASYYVFAVQGWHASPGVLWALIPLCMLGLPGAGFHCWSRIGGMSVVRGWAAVGTFKQWTRTRESFDWRILVAGVGAMLMAAAWGGPRCIGRCLSSALSSQGMVWITGACAVSVLLLVATVRVAAPSPSALRGMVEMYEEHGTPFFLCVVHKGNGYAMLLLRLREAGFTVIEGATHLEGFYIMLSSLHMAEDTACELHQINMDVRRAVCSEMQEHLARKQFKSRKSRVDVRSAVRIHTSAMPGYEWVPLEPEEWPDTDSDAGRYEIGPELEQWPDTDSDTPVNSHHG